MRLTSFIIKNVKHRVKLFEDSISEFFGVYLIFVICTALYMVIIFLIRGVVPVEFLYLDIFVGILSLPFYVFIFSHLKKFRENRRAVKREIIILLSGYLKYTSATALSWIPFILVFIGLGEVLPSTLTKNVFWLMWAIFPLFFISTYSLGGLTNLEHVDISYACLDLITNFDEATSGLGYMKARAVWNTILSKFQENIKVLVCWSTTIYDISMDRNLDVLRLALEIGDLKTREDALSCTRNIMQLLDSQPMRPESVRMLLERISELRNLFPRFWEMTQNLGILYSLRTTTFRKIQITYYVIAGIITPLTFVLILLSSLGVLHK